MRVSLSETWLRGPVLGRAPVLIAAVALALPAAALALPAAAAAAPDHAYVTDSGGPSVDEYGIGTGGVLSFGASTPAGNEPWMQAITPNGKYLYAANFSGTQINQYRIGSSGALTSLSPAQVTTGSEPYGVAVSPDGKNLYVAVYDTGSVGVYDIGSTGGLTLSHTVTTDISAPSGIAISPDGKSVYVANSDNTIAEFNRASDGSLTPKATPTVPSVFTDIGMLVITPDGKNVYGANAGSPLVDEYSVGTGGELSAKATPTITTGTTGENYALTVSPDGRSVYVPNYNFVSGIVSQFTVGSGGELAPKSTFQAPASTGSIFIWFTADGKSAYVPAYLADTTDQYNVASSGELSPKSTPSVAHGSGLLSVVIPPDQGPVARFSSQVAKIRKATKFDASKSSDSDGTVVSYHWNFGDGHSLTTTKAIVSHTYRKAGKHKVTLTVTDDSGCSTALVFTGQTAYCDGTSAARTSYTVKVAAKPLKLAVSPSSAKAGQKTCYAFSATSGGHGVKGVSVRLSGRTTSTGSAGLARLCLTLKKGTYTAEASKAGYRKADARIRVTAASPVFTG